VPSASHLPQGRVVRRPPTLSSADASTASGISAGFFLLGGVPGTRCGAQRLAVRKRKLCALVSSSLFSHHHRASYHDLSHSQGDFLSPCPTSHTFSFFILLSPAFPSSQSCACFPASSLPCLSFAPHRAAGWGSSEQHSGQLEECEECA